MEDRPSSLSSTTLARTLSVAGHPFLLIPVTIAVASRNWVWTAVVGAATVLPLLYVTLRNVRRGTWSDHDVSRHDQRGGLYRVAFPLVAITALILYFMGASAPMMRGMAAAALMLGAGLAGNRFLKISMHMMTAAYCAVIMVRAWPLSAFAVVPLLAGIAWSRRKLDRHTLAEVVTGLAIGLAAGLFAVLV